MSKPSFLILGYKYTNIKKQTNKEHQFLSKNKRKQQLHNTKTNMLIAYVNIRIVFLGITISKLELKFCRHFVRKLERKKQVAVTLFCCVNVWSQIRVN